MLPPVLMNPEATRGIDELEVMLLRVAQVSLIVALEFSPGNTTFAIMVIAIRLPLAGDARHEGVSRLLSIRQSRARTVVRVGNAAGPPTPTVAVSSLTGSGMRSW